MWQAFQVGAVNFENPLIQYNSKQNANMYISKKLLGKKKKGLF